MTLEMKGIYKSFGANDVLRDVSFTLNGGEICALLGENGAGKSTLMNILGGVHHADQGQILLDGKRVAFQTPADSLKHGIAFIHQELNLVNDLAIYENMFIGHELRKKNRFLDSAAMIAKTNEVFKKMDLDLDPRIMVRDLDASYKQIVEIARALLMEASIIIMDEPTLGIDPEGMRELLNIIRDLSVKDGRTVLISSHQLQQIQQVCDRVGIYVEGTLVACGTLAELEAHIQKNGTYLLEVDVEPCDDQILGMLAGQDGILGIAKEGRRFMITSKKDIRPQLTKFLGEHDYTVMHLHQRGGDLDEIYRRYFEKAGQSDESNKSETKRKHGWKHKSAGK